MIEENRQIPYCAGGLIYKSDNPEIALIYKSKPIAVKDKWNFIGGKIEVGETPVEAMEREFLEEAGILIPKDNWRGFAVLHGQTALIYFFVAFCDNKEDIKTMESEPVSWHSISDALKMPNLASNLKFLIPLALDESEFTTLIFSKNLKHGRIDR